VVHAANVYIYNNTMFRELILFPFSGYWFVIRLKLLYFPV
jgi:hypothetical protein